MVSLWRVSNYFLFYVFHIRNKNTLFAVKRQRREFSEVRKQFSFLIMVVREVHAFVKTQTTVYHKRVNLTI